MLDYLIELLTCLHFKLIHSYLISTYNPLHLESEFARSSMSIKRFLKKIQLRRRRVEQDRLVNSKHSTKTNIQFSNTDIMVFQHHFLHILSVEEIKDCPYGVFLEQYLDLFPFSLSTVKIVTLRVVSCHYVYATNTPLTLLIFRNKRT